MITLEDLKALEDDGTLRFIEPSVAAVLAFEACVALANEQIREAIAAQAAACLLQGVPVMVDQNLKNCERCGHKQYVYSHGANSGPCICANAPEGASLVIGVAGCVLGWTVPLRPLRTYRSAEMTIRVGDRVLETSEINYTPIERTKGPVGRTVGKYSFDWEEYERSHPALKPVQLSPLATVAAPTQYPVLNDPMPGTWEAETVEIPIASGDLEVLIEKQCTGPAKQVDGRIVFGPAHGNEPPTANRTPCPVSVRRVRVRRSDFDYMRRVVPELGAGSASASDGAYARGVKAALEAVATAKYDHERDHQEWSVRDVVVPKDSG